MKSKLTFRSSCEPHLIMIFVLFCLTLSLSWFPIAKLQAQTTFTRVTEGHIATASDFSHGVAWGDFNDDGYLDLFVGNEGFDTPGNNYLYQNNEDGTFTLSTASAVTTDEGNAATSGNWADYDNDGDLDLLVTDQESFNNNLLYSNDGGGGLLKVTSGVIVENSTGATIGASWADYDNDGDLDLFTATHGFSRNQLFENNGDGTFTRITDGAIPNDQSGISRCGVWADYDNDGDVDLFVANQLGSNSAINNFLYSNNDDGTFTKITEGEIVTDLQFSEGGSWADYDNDGDLDLFVTNSAPPPNPPDGTDYIYSNNGDSTFTKESGLGSSSDESNGSCWGDFDNDGDLDLYVARSATFQASAPNIFYWNNNDGTFTSQSDTNEVQNSRGVAAGDYDNDGDLDLFIANISVAATQGTQDNALLTNDGNNNNWVNINCVGVTSNVTAIGTKVRLKATISGQQVWQMREIASQTGTSGQNSLRVHFGLGDTSIIDSLQFEWPSGIVDLYLNTPANMFFEATEGTGLQPIVTSVESDDDNLPQQFQLSQNFPNPFNPTTTIEYTLPARSEVSVRIYTILGTEVRTLINQMQEPGRHKIEWDGRNAQGQLASSGLYIYRVEAGSLVAAKKMIFMK